MDQQRDGRTNRWTNTDIWMDRKREGWTNGWTDQQRDRQRDGQMDGQTKVIRALLAATKTIIPICKIWPSTTLIYRLLDSCIRNVHMKSENGIPKQIEIGFWKPWLCRWMEGWTHRQAVGEGNPVYSLPSSLGGWIINAKKKRPTCK